MSVADPQRYNLNLQAALGSREIQKNVAVSRNLIRLPFPEGISKVKFPLDDPKSE